MTGRSLSALLVALVLAAEFAAPAVAPAQVIVTQTSANDGITIFPTPTTGLPNPTAVAVTGLPQPPERPHGVTCFDDDTCVVGDFLGISSDTLKRIFIVKVSTASVIGILNTPTTYSGQGTLAVNRARTHVLGTPGVPPASLAVIPTPVTPSSTVSTVPLAGAVSSAATSAIVFDPADRAFVCNDSGISVLEPPYTSVAFVIPLPPPPNNSCVSLALTPDGSQLLVPAVTFGAVQGFVRVFNAPFSAASTFEVIDIPGATTATGFTNLQGIAMSPDGTKALVVGNRDPKVWAISAPFGTASLVEQIPLPAGFTTGFEDVAISPDGQLAILGGQGSGPNLIPFIQAPFTAAATVYPVPIPGGRGNGAARFVRSTPAPPTCGPSNPVSLPAVTIGGVGPAAQVVPLAAAVLPVSRSVQVGCPATAFVSVINGGAEIATGVGVAPVTNVPGQFLYQTTDPATNALINAPNVAVDIPVGGTQSFVVAFTPSAPFPPTDVAFSFAGGNTIPVDPRAGLNTLLLSASLAPVPDVVALAATTTNDGIINVPGASGTGAFAVATVNLGLGASITVSADTGSAVLPVNLFVCQTDPGTGACLQTPAASVTTTIAGGATPTFTILVQGAGASVPFDPAGSRVFVRFRDAQNETRGSTSVAVRTQ